jgi:hypothetical protein
MMQQAQLQTTDMSFHPVKQALPYTPQTKTIISPNLICDKPPPPPLSVLRIENGSEWMQTSHDEDNIQESQVFLPSNLGITLQITWSKRLKHNGNYLIAQHFYFDKADSFDIEEYKPTSTKIHPTSKLLKRMRVYIVSSDQTQLISLLKFECNQEIQEVIWNDFFRLRQSNDSYQTDRDLPEPFFAFGHIHRDSQRQMHNEDLEELYHFSLLCHTRSNTCDSRFAQLLRTTISCTNLINQSSFQKKRFENVFQDLLISTNVHNTKEIFIGQPFHMNFKWLFYEDAKREKAYIVELIVDKRKHSLSTSRITLKINEKNVYRCLSTNELDLYNYYTLIWKKWNDSESRWETIPLTQPFTFHTFFDKRKNDPFFLDEVFEIESLFSQYSKEKFPISIEDVTKSLSLIGGLYETMSAKIQVLLIAVFIPPDLNLISTTSSIWEKLNKHQIYHPWVIFNKLHANRHKLREYTSYLLYENYHWDGFNSHHITKHSYQENILPWLTKIYKNQLLSSSSKKDTIRWYLVHVNFSKATFNFDRFVVEYQTDVSEFENSNPNETQPVDGNSPSSNKKSNKVHPSSSSSSSSTLGASGYSSSSFNNASGTTNWASKYNKESQKIKVSERNSKTNALEVRPFVLYKVLACLDETKQKVIPCVAKLSVPKDSIAAFHGANSKIRVQTAKVDWIRTIGLCSKNNNNNNSTIRFRYHTHLKDQECEICFEQRVNIIFPCHHSICEPCWRKLLSNASSSSNNPSSQTISCPFCKRTIDSKHVQTFQPISSSLSTITNQDEEGDDQKDDESQTPLLDDFAKQATITTTPEEIVCKLLPFGYVQHAINFIHERKSMIYSDQKTYHIEDFDSNLEHSCSSGIHCFLSDQDPQLFEWAQCLLKLSERRKSELLCSLQSLII